MAENENKVEDLTPEQIQQIIRERDEAKAAVNNTVEEIKEMRKRKQELEAEKLALEAKLKPAETTPTTSTPDIDKLLEEKLNEKLTLKDREAVKLEEELAMKEFIARNPEFAPETDTSGLRLETFKKELNRFNTAGARTKEDFLSVMQDAISLMYRKENREYRNPYESSPSRSGGSNHVADTASLTPRETETMKRMGWDAKKMLEMKMKHPELYDSVFNEK
jgi:hypothetical protein